MEYGTQQAALALYSEKWHPSQDEHLQDGSRGLKSFLSATAVTSLQTACYSTSCSFRHAQHDKSTVLLEGKTRFAGGQSSRKTTTHDKLPPRSMIFILKVSTTESLCCQSLRLFLLYSICTSKETQVAIFLSLNRDQIIIPYRSYMESSFR